MPPPPGVSTKPRELRSACQDMLGAAMDIAAGEDSFGLLLGPFQLSIYLLVRYSGPDDQLGPFACEPYSSNSYSA